MLSLAEALSGTVSDGTSNTIVFIEKSVGLVPGQTARVSAFNDDPEQPLRAELKVFDAEGNQIAHRETVVPPGRFRYMDVNRLDITQPGESPQVACKGRSPSVSIDKRQPDCLACFPVGLKSCRTGKQLRLGSCYP
jgi:hypothetical protein